MVKLQGKTNKPEMLINLDEGIKEKLSKLVNDVLIRKEISQHKKRGIIKSLCKKDM